MENRKVKENELILAQNQYYDLDCFKTQVNNNVLVVGSPGSGKTRSIVSPNILQASGSYIIVDPKGNLYGKYAGYLRQNGYRVQKLNFAVPGDPETVRYNFFRYIRNDQDVLKIAHMLIKTGDSHDHSYGGDPFWDSAAELLLVALIGYLVHYADSSQCNLKNILKLVQACDIAEEYSGIKSALDEIFEEIGAQNPDDFSYCKYKSFRQAANRTLKSILITVSSKLAVFDTKEIRSLFASDSVNISDIGKRKTALFVVVSDTDRSMDPMANLFFTQAINELCRVADEMPGQRLPIDVRLILDDFATNVCIGEFPRMIASIRSRGISTMLMIQAESQLRKAYGEDCRTIIGSCDTYVYLGGNDVETAKNVAQRANLPLKSILHMPIGTNWIFRRGQQPVKARNFDLDSFAKEKLQQPRRVGEKSREITDDLEREGGSDSAGNQQYYSGSILKRRRRDKNRDQFC